MLFLFVSIFLHGMAMSGDPIDCPYNKKVGDTCYTRVKHSTPTQEYGCMQNCTYRKTSEPENGNLYCFKAGPLPVTECDLDLETSDTSVCRCRMLDESGDV